MFFFWFIGYMCSSFLDRWDTSCKISSRKLLISVTKMCSIFTLENRIMARISETVADTMGMSTQEGQSLKHFKITAIIGRWVHQVSYRPLKSPTFILKGKEHHIFLVGSAFNASR